MTSSRTCDVAVVGAGPAGAALAAALAPLWDVVLIDRDAVPQPRIGESLIPAAGRVLQDLGLLAGVDALGFTPYIGNRSWWNGACETTDFLADPLGAGWHLDRRVFEAYLRERAAARGAHCLFGVECRVMNTSGTPQIDLALGSSNGDSAVVSAKLVVDATGRRASIARSLGARRSSVDDQVARWTSWTTARESIAQDTDGVGFSAVESEPDGWWYLALLPLESGALTTVLAHHQQRAAGARASGDELLRMCRQRPGLGRFLPRDGSGERLQAHTVAADSARLDRVAGANWLAVGDAALSFDPIASRGLFNALYTALTAASIIDASLQAGTPCLAEYEADLDRVWATYLLQRSWIYESERTWTDRPYWIERQRPG